MKRYFFLTAIIFLGHFSHAQSLLWKISGNGLTQPSYLYGTIHIQDERAFMFNDSVLVDFDRCKAVVNEMQLDSIDPMKLMMAMTLDSGKTLHDYMTEKQYKKLSKKFNASTGLDLETFKGFRPVILSVLMSENQFDKQMAEALDVFFQQRGKDQNKKTLGLETMDEQIKALVDVPIKEQIDMLFKDEPAAKDMKKETDKMIELYHKADLDALYNWSMKNESGTDFEDALLTSRNGRMADRIVPIIQKQPAFIAIGALHLPGKDGVIALLKEKGFKVEPIGGIGNNAAPANSDQPQTSPH